MKIAQSDRKAYQPGNSGSRCRFVHVCTVSLYLCVVCSSRVINLDGQRHIILHIKIEQVRQVCVGFSEHDISNKFTGDLDLSDLWHISRITWHIEIPQVVLILCTCVWRTGYTDVKNSMLTSNKQWEIMVGFLCEHVAPSCLSIILHNDSSVCPVCLCTCQEFLPQFKWCFLSHNMPSISILVCVTARKICVVMETDTSL